MMRRGSPVETNQGLSRGPTVEQFRRVGRCIDRCISCECGSLVAVRCADRVEFEYLAIN